MSAPIEGIDWGSGAVSLRLENGRVSGTGGINRLTGDYELSDTRLSIGPVAMTMMAGPPAAMESELTFLALLARVERWSIDQGQFVLSDDAGGELIRLQQNTTAKESTMEFIHTC